jgi:hypothetical protein
MLDSEQRKLVILLLAFIASLIDPLPGDEVLIAPLLTRQLIKLAPLVTRLLSKWRPVYPAPTLPPW